MHKEALLVAKAIISCSTCGPSSAHRPPPPVTQTLSHTHTQHHPDAHAEKVARSLLRAATDRALQRPNTYVVLDYMAGIKGYRYELWCMVRERATRCALLHCVVPRDVVETWRDTASSKDGMPSPTPPGCPSPPSSSIYQPHTPSIFDDLWTRFEVPDTRNRWDRPLFEVDPRNGPLLARTVHAVVATLRGTRVVVVDDAVDDAVGLDDMVPPALDEGSLLGDGDGDALSVGVSVGNGAGVDDGAAGVQTHADVQTLPMQGLHIGEHTTTNHTAATIAAATNTPAAVTNTPAAATNTPAAATNTPAAATNTPAAATNTPAAAFVPATRALRPTIATTRQLASDTNRRTMIDSATQAVIRAVCDAQVRVCGGGVAGVNVVYVWCCLYAHGDVCFVFDGFCYWHIR